MYYLAGKFGSYSKICNQILETLNHLPKIKGNCSPIHSLFKSFLFCQKIHIITSGFWPVNKMCEPTSK